MAGRLHLFAGSLRGRGAQRRSDVVRLRAVSNVFATGDPKGLSTSSMMLVVRPADLERERGLLLELLKSQLSDKMSAARFDWLYRGCPYGKAKVWVAAEKESGTLAGAASVFPRQLFVAGKRETGCVLGDFCISAKYRSLGPALRLQKKCIGVVGGNDENSEFARGYDLPSTSMLAVYKRLGVRAEGKVVRMARLLHTERRIRSKIKFGPVARAVGSGLDAAIALSGGSLRMRSEAKVEGLEGRCGPEFTELAENVRDRWGVCVVRSAEFLNWRYVDHPERKHRIVAARRGRKLAGYAVWEIDAGIATVADLYDCGQQEVRMDLIRTIITTAKEAGAESVNVSLPSGHQFCEELKRVGFRERESSPLVYLGTASLETKWLLLDGDRES